MKLPSRQEGGRPSCLPPVSRAHCLRNRKLLTRLFSLEVFQGIHIYSLSSKSGLRQWDCEKHMQPSLQSVDGTFFDCRLTTLREQAIPPWRNMPSRDLAKLLGVSLQVLANWRIRGCGPAPAPHRRGNGNRTVYRRSAVMEWLSGMAGQPQPEWMHVRDWLVRFRLLDGEPTEAEVANAVAHLAQFPTL